MADNLESMLGINTPSPASSTNQPEDVPASVSSGLAASVMSRYRDAYLVARATAAFGTAIKVIGFLLALGLFAGATAVAGQQYGSTRTLYTMAGVVMAVITAAVFYLFGVLVSAQGQILKASLDNAVNGSPFLTNDQRAKTMSL